MTGELLVLENVGKVYRQYASELKRFARWFGLPFKPDGEHWVLRHVGFRVRTGESVGIVGQNGAGKSTLLKLVTGTALQNEGSIRLRGRVSALLELGLGFNPELTGRENARHAAGLMGLSRLEIDALIDAIEAFAEIGEYFDQPLRTYSSGMQMRVAFSVATAVRPDLLIVDEALSVGDAYFVHKSFQRIRDFKAQGTSLLIVSHDPGAIQSLCDRAVLLEKGRVILDGAPTDVLDYYNALIAEKENTSVRTRVSGDRTVTESGTRQVVFLDVRLLDEKNRPVEYVQVGDHITLSAHVRALDAVPTLVFGYMIRDRLGQPVFGTNTQFFDRRLAEVGTGEEVVFSARFRCDLGPGTYSISVALHGGESHLIGNYQWKDLALVFTVANSRLPHFVGCAFIPPEFSVRRAEGGSTGQINRETINGI